MAPDLYSSLPLVTPRSIRLLELDENDRSADCGRFIANLRVVSLDEEPEFDALSYVWSQATTMSHSVLCGCHEIKVTQSCYLALLYLRQKVKRLSIWVDAICIDQQGEEEKRHQLPLMQAIYTHAKTVYIWLGIGNCATARAMNFFSTGVLRDQCLRDKETQLWKRFSGFSYLKDIT